YTWWKVANMTNTAQTPIPAEAKHIWMRNLLAGHPTCLARTCAVGSYQPNGFGLYDMHGNVWEGCEDWYDAGYYATSPTNDPSGPPLGSVRVGRGGSWRSAGYCCRSAYRFRASPAGDNALGFRVALVPSQ